MYALSLYLCIIYILIMLYVMYICMLILLYSIYMLIMLYNSVCAYYIIYMYTGASVDKLRQIIFSKIY